MTILYRGESLEKSMSRYLVDQLAGGIEHRRALRPAHGDTALAAIDVLNSAMGETKRLESSGLFLFIGADGETAWLPPEIVLDRRGFVFTGADVAAAGAWPLERRG